MAKDSSKVRRLPGAGDGPLEPEDPRVKFTRRMGQAIDGPFDQIVSLLCRDGQIVDIIALRENRHEVRGVLEEAFPIYDEMMRPICTCEE